MSNSVKISLYVPGGEERGKHFSVRLKRELLVEPSKYDGAERILAVPDVKGNFRSFYKLLLQHRVINNKYEWTFGSGHLIIAGNYFVANEQIAECLWFIYSLEDKARREGGYVHFILGGNEIENIDGNWRYMQPKYVRPEVSESDATILYDGCNELRRWLYTKNVMEKIGDLLFLHDDIADGICRYDIPVEEINSAARARYSRGFQLLSEGHWNAEGNGDLISTIMGRFNVKAVITSSIAAGCFSGLHSCTVVNIAHPPAADNPEALFIQNNEFYQVDLKGIKKRIA